MATKTTSAPQKAAPAKVAPKAATPTAKAPVAVKKAPAKATSAPVKAAAPAPAPAPAEPKAKVVNTAAPVKAVAAKPAAAKPAATKAPVKAKAAPATATEGEDGNDGEGDESTAETGASVGRKEVAESVRNNLAVAGFAVSPKLSVAIVQALEAAIQSHLAAGESVTLPGFGKFKVGLRAGGERRNPRSGEMVMVPSAWAPSFKVGKALKEAAQSRPVPTE